MKFRLPALCPIPTPSLVEMAKNAAVQDGCCIRIELINAPILDTRRGRLNSGERMRGAVG
jgi:hypothetical protein